MKGRQAYLETHVLSAEPMELVCLLYQHGIDAVRDAKGHLGTGDVAARSAAVSKAIGIIGELNSALDHSSGGTISRSLEQLYAYMTQRLTEANARRQAEPFAEVESLLSTLSQAWQEAKTKQAPVSTHVAEPATPVWKEANLDAAVHAWSA